MTIPDSISKIRILLFLIVERYRLIVIFKLILFLLIVWIVGATWLYFTEKDYKPTQDEIQRGELNFFDSYPRAYKNILVYLFSGFEEYIPHTTAGWLGSILVMLFGSFGLLALLIGNVTSIIQERARRAGYIKLRPSLGNFRGHIVICNWNEKGFAIIKQLRNRAFGRILPIIIVSESATEIAIQDKRLYRQVWAVDGDPRHVEALTRADIQHSHAAVVLANKSSFNPGNEQRHASQHLQPGDSVDARSTLIAKSIEAINPNVHTVVDIADVRSQKRFAAGVINEMISVEEFAERLLARTAQTHGMANVLSHLLSPTPDTNEIYLVPVPKRLIGRTYRFAQSALLEQEDEDLLPIGYRASNGPAAGKVVMNPRRRSPGDRKSELAADYRLMPEDVLVIIAYRFPTLKVFQ